MRNIFLILMLLASFVFTSQMSAQAVILKTDTVTIDCKSSDTFLIPVRVRNFTNVGSMQFTVSWNPADLDYAYTTPLNPLFLQGAVNVGFDSSTYQASGRITFTWTRFGGLSVPNESTIFSLAFRRIGGPFSSVSISGAPVQIEITDANGNELMVQTLTGGVQPIDDTPPSIVCPDNVIVGAIAPSAVNDIAPLSAIDNCSIPNVGWSSTGATTGNAPNDPDASGTIFNFGTTTVVYRATDVGMNTATCSFTVTLEVSNNSDMLTLIAQSGSAACGQMYSVDITALNFDSLGSLQFSLGWNPAVLQYASFSNLNPTLLLSASNFGTSSTGSGFLSFSWTTNSLFGTTIPNNGVLFRLNFNVIGGSTGTSLIQFGDFPSVREAYTSAVSPPEEIPATYINGQANFADQIPPSISCPSNAMATADVGNSSAPVANLAPTAVSDNCSTVTYSYVSSGATATQGNGNADGNYNVGLSMVTYIASDASGNTATCAFNVLVNSSAGLGLSVDTVAVDCQSSGVVAFNVRVQDFNDLIGLQFSLGWNPTVLQFDSVGNGYPGLNLDAADFLNYIGTPGGLLRFLSGNPVFPYWPSIPDGGILFTVYFTVLNSNGTTDISFVPPYDAVNTAFNSVPFNTTSGYFSIADQSPPTITCPDNIQVDAQEGMCSETVILPLPDAQDACGMVQEIISSKDNDVFAAGETTVFFTAYDQAGNSASCSVTVIVSENLPPQINNCPANISVTAPADTCTFPIYWDIPEAIDSCGQGGVSLSADYAPGDLFSVGTTTVTYEASDASGNVATCIFTVEIRDTILPVVVCPEDMIVVPDSGFCSAVVNLDAPLVSDNCDNNPTLSGYEATLTLDAGINLITYTATDAYGNTGTCSFNITIFDNNAPVFDKCPDDLTIDTAQDTCGAFPTWVTPNATDDCDADGVDIFADYESGGFLPVGTTIVTYSAVDNVGNIGTCSFAVTISENIPPVITGCPANVLIELPMNKCDSLITWILPQATDNCGTPTLESEFGPGFFPAGTTTVVYTATDLAGNTSVCSFDVVLIDLVPPVFTSCPEDVTVSTESPCGVAVEWLFPTATDNCTEPLSFESSFMPGDTFSVGTTTLVIRAYDASNNYDTCTFIITVNGPFKRFEQIPLPIELSGCDSVASWTPPIAVGFCSLDTLFSNFEPGDTFPVGVTTVQYTAVDNDGFTTTATFTVTVTAGLPPQITCPTAEVIVNTAGGLISNPGNFISEADPMDNCSTTVLSFGSPQAIDDCGIPQVVQTGGPLSGSIFPVGRDTLTFVATDASGSSAQCSVIIEVVPIRPLDPTAAPNPGCAGNTVVLTVPPIDGATYSWTGPQGFTASTNQVTIASLTPNNAGTYIVQASINGCTTPPDTIIVQLALQPNAVDDTGFNIAPTALDTFNILLNDLLTPASDFVITEISPLNGVTNLGNGNFSYQAGAEPGNVSFFYEVCSQSCPLLCDMATVTIRIDDVTCSFIPNIFTPNGDGVNDLLEIPCLKSGFFDNNSLVVYNQWGDKVYEAAPYSNDPALAWDGTLDGQSGKDLPDGVYYYIFQPGPNEATVKGFIEIFR